MDAPLAVVVGAEHQVRVEDDVVSQLRVAQDLVEVELAEARLGDGRREADRRQRAARDVAALGPELRGVEPEQVVLRQESE